MIVFALVVVSAVWAHIPDLPDPCSVPGTASFANAIAVPLDGGNVTIAYTVACAARTIHFTVSGRSRGWLGVGFNANGLMIGADLWQIGVVDGRVVVRDGFSTASRVVVVDRFMADANASLTADGLFTASFVRPFDAASANDWSFAHGKPCFVIAASSRHASLDLKHHREAITREPVQLFLTAADSETLESFEHNERASVAHGFFMLWAWMALAPAAAFVARFLKGLGRPWFLFHASVGFAVWLLTFGSVLVIVFERHWLGNSHNRHPHSLLGLVVLFLVTGQAVLGAVADRRYDKDRKAAPWHDVAHWWLGRVVSLAGPINCGLGVYLIAGDRIQAGFWIYIVMLVAVIALLVAGAVALRGSAPAPAGRLELFRNVAIGVVVLGFLPSVVIPLVALYEDRGGPM